MPQGALYRGGVLLRSPTAQPLQIRLYTAPVLCARVRGEGRSQHHARIVDEDVGAAKLLLLALGGGDDRVAIGDIGFDGDRAGAELADEGLDAVRAARE
jgi:hypothetical protein